jgi:tRNA(fMet)-specific endonuclease VapC
MDRVMRYMLDSNIVSHAIRRQPNVVARLESVSVEECCISAVVRGELRFGVANNPSATKLARLVEAFFDTVVTLPWNARVADAYGELRASLQRAGKRSGELDEMIAAHAWTEGLVLLTANARHFEHIEGLVVEDWTKPL